VAAKVCLEMSLSDAWLYYLASLDL
jgi:hypothetical protein